MPQQIALNDYIKEYNNKSSLGFMSILGVSTVVDKPELTTYAVGTRRFDITTGERLPDTIIGVTSKQLEIEREELVKRLAELDSFIAETEKFAKPVVSEETVS